MSTARAITETHANFINGKWVAPQTGEYYARTNPARPLESLGNFPSSAERDVDLAIEAAETAASAWADTPGPQRGALLFRFAQLLEASKTELAKIITREQGKALCESTGEVGRAAVEARYMAGEASRICGQSFPSERPGFSAYTVLEPLGVVAAICPWNFPVVTPVRKIAPALAFGNTVVFKPASLTPWSAVFVTRLLEEAGVPPGVVNLVMGPGARVGSVLVADRRVRGISFTGSTDVGVPLYEAAARHLASVQLELGGKNPAIVIDYADLDEAAREIVSAAFLCSGQRCTALSRVIVTEEQADALVAKILSYVKKIQVGDGMLETTTMGPLVNRSQFDTVERYVAKGVESGCKLLYGGKALGRQPDQDGYYFSPTLFDQVPASSALAKEEIFGPVLPVIRVRDVDEAISVANGTRYGLAASVFTSRFDVASRCMRRIQAGMIHVNHGTASQAHVPFGGRKDSGQGAFSIGPTAKDFFTNVKTIYGKW
ncbi:MAG: aldehyde dehydrogenase family protein [Candidatus Korobacteraceae bacterium]|jgi:aldehyde dehydrogenase (NAD+)